MTYHIIIQIQGHMSNIIRETYDIPPDTTDIGKIEKNYTEQYGTPAIVTNVFSTRGYNR